MAEDKVLVILDEAVLTSPWPVDYLVTQRKQIVPCSSRELGLLIAHLAELRMPTLPNLSYPHKCVSCDKRVHKNNSCGACPDCVADRRRSRLEVCHNPAGHLSYKLELDDKTLWVGCAPHTDLKAGDVAYAIVRFGSAARKGFTFSDYADTPNAPHEEGF